MAERARVSSWLPPESSNDELADERTRLMAAAAIASPQPASPTKNDTRWLPNADTADQPADGLGSWLPTESASTRKTAGEPVGEEPVGEEPVGEEPVGEEPASPLGVLTSSRRQALAVEAYCRELCPPETAAAAIAEVLESSAGKSDEKLLRDTRMSAAKHAVAPKRRGRQLPPDCAPTYGRLAARANDDLGPEEREGLERHLDSCINCQAAEQRTRRAERAFAGIAGIALAREEFAPAPTPTPVPEPAAAVEPVAAVPEAEAAATTDAPASEWMPAGAPAAAALGTSEIAAPPAHARRRRRPPLAAALAGAAAVAVAAVMAVVALSGGRSHNSASVARSTAPAPTTSTPAPVHHKSAVKHRVVKKHHATAKKPAVHQSGRASSPAPAVASVTPTATAAASAPVSQPAAPAPAPSTSSSSSGSTQSSSSPSVSISQGSLGATSAKQGIK